WPSSSCSCGGRLARSLSTCPPEIASANVRSVARAATSASSGEASAARVCTCWTNVRSAWSSLKLSDTAQHLHVVGVRRNGSPGRGSAEQRCVPGGQLGPQVLDLARGDELAQGGQHRARVRAGHVRV